VINVIKEINHLTAVVLNSVCCKFQLIRVLAVTYQFNGHSFYKRSYDYMYLM